MRKERKNNEELFQYHCTSESFCDLNEIYVPEDIYQEKNKFRKFLIEKYILVKNHNFQINNVLNVVKFLRRKFNLNKSPKKKGYGNFISKEHQR